MHVRRLYSYHGARLFSDIPLITRCAYHAQGRVNSLGPIADISAIISTICFRRHNLYKKCQNLTKFSHNYRGPAHGIYFGYFPDISVWPAAMFEGSNVQWRLGKIAFHIADKLRRQLTRQG